MQREHPQGQVRITSGRETRLPTGYLWVFAGDIASVTGNPAPGALVQVLAHDGKVCGQGFYNPRSKIRVRLLTQGTEPIDEAFFRGRLLAAVARRARVVAGISAYRLVHGEGDLLPGLIVDRYDDVLVLQALSAGIDQRTHLLADLLTEVTGCTRIYLRNDVASRKLEGLPTTKGYLRGNGPTRVEIVEGSARFVVDVERGQKTGWFCDQRENRLAASALARGADVLDAFCHTGGFGVQAALAGAKSVLGLDTSTEATRAAVAHAELNGVGATCRYNKANVFDELRKLDLKGQGYDLVILDPPAFAKSRQSARQATAGYKDINLRALRLLRPQGFLVTCSCSHHVGERELWHAILQSARDARRKVQLVESRPQPDDHPVLAAMPETRYLKCLIVQAL